MGTDTVGVPAVSFSKNRSDDMTYKPIKPIDPPYPAIYEGSLKKIVPCHVTGRAGNGFLRIKIQKEHKGSYGGGSLIYDVTKYVHPGSVHRPTNQ